MEIIWSNLSQKKLNSIYEYFSYKASEKIAKKLIAGIINSTKTLTSFPDQGQFEPNLINKSQQFRYLVFKNYKIIYFVNLEKNSIRISNIFDTRQNPIKVKLQAK
ncbi:MAG: type II toxin-antitoxin system RelE/ParE family toxin [Flavobacteriales bacterium]|nr:type II toxin-antitoxin system RelE/ParE family toxin [Flavobacteriales bacterium]